MENAEKDIIGYVLREQRKLKKKWFVCFRGYGKDDIQKEILKAAEKVFLENGFPKASMREIAQEAQVGLSNIYNYFKSKDDIFCTVVRPVISAFERMLHEHHGRYGADIMEM